MIKIKLNSHIALDEGRVDDMKKKYPGKDDIIDLFSTVPGNNKYLDWMMKNHEQTSTQEMMTIVTKFHKQLGQIQKKDINAYRDFDELYDAVDLLAPPKTHLERSGTIELYEDDDMSISRPLNEEAACKLGANTKWCISATESENYFYPYAAANASHYIIHLKNLSPKNPMYKFSYTFKKEGSRLRIAEIRDALNNQSENFSRGEIAEKLDNIFGDGQAREQKIYDIIFEHASRNIPSHEQTKEQSEAKRLARYYNELDSLKGEEYENSLSSEHDAFVSEVMYSIFFEVRMATPPFIRNQFKKLIGLNNKFVNHYFKKTIENPGRGNRIAGYVENFLSPELKAVLYKNIEADSVKEKELYMKKINELADELLSSRHKQGVKILRKSAKKETIISYFSSHFSTYSKQEIEDALELAYKKLDDEEKPSEVTESKLFKFNSDKKMFKFMRQ